jgi:fatty-acyl-CoA synthase
MHLAQPCATCLSRPALSPGARARPSEIPVYTDDFDPPTLGDITRKHASLAANAPPVFSRGADQFPRCRSAREPGRPRTGRDGGGPAVAYRAPGKNSDQYFELLYGAAKARVILAPVNWRLAPAEIAYIVNDCRAQVLFVGPEFIDVVRAIAADLKTVTRIVAMERAAGDWPAFQDWRDAQPDTECGRVATVDDVAIQLYTSGTTGHPEGAMLAHRNLCRPRIEDPLRQRDWNLWTPDDVSLVAMPVFHIGGSGAQIGAMRYGAKCVIRREFDPNRVLEDFVEHRHLAAVPRPCGNAVHRPPAARRARRDYSRLKYIMYGASPIPVDLLRECMSVFGCGFVQMYGMTETTGTHRRARSRGPHAGGRAAHACRRQAAAGRGDRDPRCAGRSAGFDQVGEIATRSVANMMGYWNLPEATARTMTDRRMAADRRDAGYVDDDGYVYIHDRVKDMIISAARTSIRPKSENAVFGHPAVSEVAVIGVPDDKWGAGRSRRSWC